MCLAEYLHRTGTQLNAIITEIHLQSTYLCIQLLQTDEHDFVPIEQIISLAHYCLTSIPAYILNLNIM